MKLSEAKEILNKNGYILEDTEFGFPEGFSNEGEYKIFNRLTGACLTATWPNGEPSWGVNVPPMKFLSRQEAHEMIKLLNNMGLNYRVNRLEIIKDGDIPSTRA